MRTYKITLINDEDNSSDNGKEINIESEIIFNNNDLLFIEDKAIIIYNRYYDICKDFKGIERITYFYKETL